jgi:hypothetical protein
MLLFFALSGMGICPEWHDKNQDSFLVVAGHSSTSEVARVSSLWRLSKACRVVTDSSSAGRVALSICFGIWHTAPGGWSPGAGGEQDPFAE